MLGAVIKRIAASESLRGRANFFHRQRKRPCQSLQQDASSLARRYCCAVSVAWQAISSQLSPTRSLLSPQIASAPTKIPRPTFRPIQNHLRSVSVPDQSFHVRCGRSIVAEHAPSEGVKLAGQCVEGLGGVEIPLTLAVAGKLRCTSCGGH